MIGKQLAQLRKDRGFTQAEVAEAMKVSPSRVSNIERSEDIMLSTLQRYVQALGGELEVCLVDMKVTKKSHNKTRRIFLSIDKLLSS